MKTYSLYNTETGVVFCTNECPSTEFLPPEGPMTGSETLAVFHGAARPALDRIEHGRVVSVGLQATREVERVAGELAFLQARLRALQATDYMFNTDYPLPLGLSALARREAIRSARQQSRDIDYQTIGPEAAMLELKSIWEGIHDVE